MVYGPGDRQRRFRWAIEPMARGDDVLEVPSAWAGWTSTYGYLEDIAEAIAACAIDDRAAGHTFNLGEREPVDHRAWARRFAAALGWQGTFKETDDPAHPFAQGLAGLDLSAPLAVDTTALRSAIGFVEPTPLADALASTIAAEAPGARES